MHKKQILFLINHLKMGGAENVFLRQAKFLSERDSKIYFGTLLKLKGERRDRLTLSKGLIEYDFNFQNLLDFSAYYNLIKFIKINSVSTVYSTLDRANIIARIIKIFFPNLKIVIRESGMANRKSLRIKFVDLLLNFFADRIIAVSSDQKNSMLAYQPIHKNKIEIIHNGAVFEESYDVIKNRLLNKNDDKIYLLHVGSMQNDNKGHEQLIEAFNKISDNKTFLYLVGDGRLRSKLQNKVGQYNLEQKIIFTGIIGFLELSELYKKSHIFILNSQSEGCPNVLLEAMSFGLPVISYNVGGANEIIENGISGYIIEKDVSSLENTIKLLLRDKDLRLKIGMNSYLRICNKFNFEKQIEKLIQVLDK